MIILSCKRIFLFRWEEKRSSEKRPSVHFDCFESSAEDISCSILFSVLDVTAARSCAVPDVCSSWWVMSFNLFAILRRISVNSLVICRFDSVRSRNLTWIFEFWDSILSIALSMSFIAVSNSNNSNRTEERDVLLPVVSISNEKFTCVDLGITRLTRSFRCRSRSWVMIALGMMSMFRCSHLRKNNEQKYSKRSVHFSLSRLVDV